MSVPRQHVKPLAAPAFPTVSSTWASGAELSERLVIPGGAASGHMLRQVLKSVGARCGGDPNAVEDLALAASEAFSNAIRHGRVSPECRIEVCIRADGETCRVVMEYPGDPFPVDAPALPDDASTTGRGRFLMAAMCDEVHYEFTEGLTRVHLTKRWR